MVLELKDCSGSIQATAFGTLWLARLDNLIIGTFYRIKSATVRRAFSHIVGFHSCDLMFTSMTKVILLK